MLTETLKSAKHLDMGYHRDSGAPANATKVSELIRSVDEAHVPRFYCIINVINVSTKGALIRERVTCCGAGT
jgi:hypothetical protein